MALHDRWNGLALDRRWGVIAERLDTGHNLCMKIKRIKTHIPFFLSRSWPLAISLISMITRMVGIDFLLMQITSPSGVTHSFDITSYFTPDASQSSVLLLCLL
jgi:hypothetical protein